jgi:hypothetical protein
MNFVSFYKSLKFRNIVGVSAFILTSALTSRAYAGGWGSGGGNARVCFKTPDSAQKVIDQKGEITDDLLDQITSIETLDLYEAELPRGLSGKKIPIAQMREGESYLDYFDRIVARAVSTVPELGRAIRDNRALFNDNTVILHDSSLKRVYDEATVASTSDKRCVLATMAVQQNTNGYWLLHIDRRLFFHPNHSELSRAALLLHEATYAVARGLGQTDSANTRLVVGDLISNSPDTKLMSLISHWISLGFLKRDDDGFGPIDNKTAPYMALSSAMFHLSQDLVAMFTMYPNDVLYNTEVKVGDRTTSALEATNAILFELKKKGNAQNVIDAIARLRKLNEFGTLDDLKDPQAAKNVLKQLETYRVQIIHKMSDYLYKQYADRYWKNMTDFDYLDASQKAALDKIAQSMIRSYIYVASIVMSQDDINDSKKPKQYPPNFIRFGFEEKVFNVADLNMVFNTNIPWVEEQARRAGEWFNSILWNTYIMNSDHARIHADELPFPAFAPKSR